MRPFARGNMSDVDAKLHAKIYPQIKSKTLKDIVLKHFLLKFNILYISIIELHKYLHVKIINLLGGPCTNPTPFIMIFGQNKNKNKNNIEPSLLINVKTWIKEGDCTQLVWAGVSPPRDRHNSRGPRAKYPSPSRSPSIIDFAACAALDRLFLVSNY